MVANEVPSDDFYTTVPRDLTLSDRVAGKLLDLIVSGQLKPGDRLPSERDLGDRFGVSRTVIREAVRSLSAKGVLRVRSGSGVDVAQVDAEHVVETMRLYLSGAGEDGGSIRYEHLHAVRAPIEIAIAGDACVAASAEDLEAIRSVCDRMDDSLHDPQAASVLDVEFHRTLAAATRNPLYLILLDSIGDLLLTVRTETLGIEGRIDHAQEFHRQILERVTARDVHGAREAMREHLDDSAQIWQGRRVELRTKPVE